MTSLLHIYSKQLADQAAVGKDGSSGVDLQTPEEMKSKRKITDLHSPDDTEKFSLTYIATPEFGSVTS